MAKRANATASERIPGRIDRGEVVRGIGGRIRRMLAPDKAVLPKELKEKLSKIKDEGSKAKHLGSKYMPFNPAMDVVRKVIRKTEPEKAKKFDDALAALKKTAAEELNLSNFEDLNPSDKENVAERIQVMLSLIDLGDVCLFFPDALRTEEEAKRFIELYDKKIRLFLTMEKQWKTVGEAKAFVKEANRLIAEKFPLLDQMRKQSAGDRVIPVD